MRAARRNAKAGDDLVEDQHDAVLPGQFTQRDEELRVDRQPCAMGAGRLDDRCRDIFILVEQPGEPLGVVLFRQQQTAGNTRQDAGCRAAVEMARITRGHMIVPAVEVMLEADQLRLAGEGAGEPHRHQGRLGAR